MAAKRFSKRLKRRALTVAPGVCFAGATLAQNASGSRFGTTAAGATITIENLDTGT
jgi:hypothetical protein